MKREPVGSSMIASVGYNAEDGVLEVEFRTGGVYEYYDVPPDVYRGLLDAESKGQFMHSHVIDMYAYSRTRLKVGAW